MKSSRDERRLRLQILLVRCSLDLYTAVIVTLLLLVSGRCP